MSFNDVTIVYVKGSAYRIYFWYMSKDDAISIMNNSNLLDERDFFKFFYQNIKNEWMQLWWRNLLSKNRDVILKEQARDKYRNLSQEEKNKKKKYGRNRYHNMSDEKKQRLKY